MRTVEFTMTDWMTNGMIALTSHWRLRRQEERPRPQFSRDILEDRWHGELDGSFRNCQRKWPPAWIEENIAMTTWHGYHQTTDSWEDIMDYIGGKPTHQQKELWHSRWNMPPESNYSGAIVMLVPRQCKSRVTTSQKTLTSELSDD